MILRGGFSLCKLLFVLLWKHSFADLKGAFWSWPFFGESIWRLPNDGEKVHDSENEVLQMFFCKYLTFWKAQGVTEQGR